MKGLVAVPGVGPGSEGIVAFAATSDFPFLIIEAKDAFVILEAFQCLFSSALEIQPTQPFFEPENAQFHARLNGQHHDNQSGRQRFRSASLARQ
ncbi:hypothetical protein CGCF413_v005628 [Colletotrichum fructicola]|nr:hypothetical protein CGCF413_v005628 [Colletotrichum fructicola]